MREKILTRQEETPGFSLKRALEGIFSFSPLKVKLAAGVISVVLVFVIGKLYVDYRGEQIIPSKKVAEVQEPPKLDIAETELGEKSPAPEKKEEKKTVLDKPGTGKGAAADRHQEVVPSKKGEEDKAIAERGREAPSFPPVTEEAAAPVPAAQAVQIPMPAEGEPEKQAVVSESKPAGAGADKEAEKKRTKIASVEDLGSMVVRDSLQERELRETLAPQVGFLRDQTPSQTASYTLDGSSTPKVGEADTIIQADSLRRVIRVWEAFIQEHPADSLSQEAYSQIATSYYLLAKASQDTSVISEASKLIGQYINQVRDSAVKDDLSRKLKQIQALRRK